MRTGLLKWQSIDNFVFILQQTISSHLICTLLEVFTLWSFFYPCPVGYYCVNFEAGGGITRVHPSGHFYIAFTLTKQVTKQSYIMNTYKNVMHIQSISFKVSKPVDVYSQHQYDSDLRSCLESNTGKSQHVLNYDHSHV